MTALMHTMTDATFAAALLSVVLYAIRQWWDRRSVNKAVMAEVGRLLEVIDRHHKFWKRCMDSNTTSHHPLIPFAHVVFDKQVKNVGVVRGNKVAAVVRFYGYVDYLNRFQALRTDYSENCLSDEFNVMYIGIRERLLGMFRGRFADL